MLNKHSVCVCSGCGSCVSPVRLARPKACFVRFHHSANWLSIDAALKSNFPLNANILYLPHLLNRHQTYMSIRNCCSPLLLPVSYSTSARIELCYIVLLLIGFQSFVFRTELKLAGARHSCIDVDLPTLRELHI